MTAKRFEITSVDTGRTFTWTEAKCKKHFGREEWLEIKAGYLPHLIVCEVESNRERAKSEAEYNQFFHACE